jgi:hypothetical protein
MNRSPCVSAAIRRAASTVASRPAAAEYTAEAAAPAHLRPAGAQRTGRAELVRSPQRVARRRADDRALGPVPPVLIHAVTVIPVVVVERPVPPFEPPRPRQAPYADRARRWWQACGR